MSITSPPVLFFLVWLSVFLMYALGLSEILHPLKLEVLYLVFSSCFFLFFGWFSSRLFIEGCMFSKLKVNIEIYKAAFTSKRTNERFSYAFVLWSVISLVEIVLAKNLPLLAELGVGAPVRYTEFGIPGLHGLSNALYLVLFLFYSVGAFFKRRKESVIILCLLCWPFLLLSRMLIVASVLQAMFFYLIIFNKASLSRYIKFSMWFLILILAFGYLGDFRSGREHILQLAELTFEYPEWLPSAFAWVYLYITTPINNLNFSIEAYDSFRLLPVETLSNLAPSFLREYLLAMINRGETYELVVNSFNVSTVFLPLVKDWGFVFAPFAFFVMGFVLFFLVINSYSNPRLILFWVVFLYASVISVFSSHLFHIVFISEALIWYFLMKYCPLHNCNPR